MASATCCEACTPIPVTIVGSLLGGSHSFIPDGTSASPYLPYLRASDRAASHSCSSETRNGVELTSVPVAFAGVYATPVGLNVAPSLITVAPYSEPFFCVSVVAVHADALSCLPCCAASCAAFQLGGPGQGVSKSVACFTVDEANPAGLNVAPTGISVCPPTPAACLPPQTGQCLSQPHCPVPSRDGCIPRAV